jgi:hypothetical protein
MDEEAKIVYDEDGEFVEATEEDDDNYRDGWDSVATDEPFIVQLDPEIIAELEAIEAEGGTTL